MNYEITEKTVIAADLDGTLAESKQIITPEMAGVISRWLATRRFAIISGGGHERFHTQVVERLSPDTRFENLYLFPTNGATCFTFKDGAWQQAYANTLSEEERGLIFASIEKALEESGIVIEKTYGEQIEYRGGQVTLSALGQQAPLSEKAPWDPDQEKRKKIASFLEPLLPEYHVAIAGATSIDVTKKGIDKQYAIERLIETLSIEAKDVLFLGDAIFPGGNDYPATQTGATCIKVKDPSETLTLLDSFV